jgi:hypothetical protein
VRYILAGLLAILTVSPQSQGSKPIIPAKTVKQTYETVGCDNGYNLASLVMGSGGIYYTTSSVSTEVFSVCVSDDLLKELRKGRNISPVKN